jgi:hypothetical protein
VSAAATTTIRMSGPIDPNINDQIAAAYRKKYCRYAARFVTPIIQGSQVQHSRTHYEGVE